MFLFRIRFGSAWFPGYVRGSVIAIAVGIAPFYAAEDSAHTSHPRRTSAFGFGCGMGFHASHVAISAWLLRSLVVLVHRRRCRHHFIFLAFRDKNRAVSANRRWCFSLMSHRYYNIISSGGRALPAPIAELVRRC